MVRKSRSPGLVRVRWQKAQAWRAVGVQWLLDPRGRGCHMEWSLPRPAGLRSWNPVSHWCRCNMLPYHPLLFLLLPVLPISDPTLCERSLGILVLPLWTIVLGLRAERRREKTGSGGGKEDTKNCLL